MVPDVIPSDSLDYLRSILVKSLSSENVGKSDVLKVKQYKNNKKVTFSAKNVVDKELRLKYLKERQNEERQRKLEEIKAQALAAQRFKEQKEMERRRRLDDLRGKEDARRQQVEERKKAIVQAEQDRLVSILKRNQEREARIESKRRNERSNIVFAFGSSTPRMLDAADMTASFWGHRRATSIQNITCASSTSLTRRQSERDLDGGSKKRATSAGGLERSGETSSRPSSSLSQQSTTSVTSSVSVRHRPSSGPRRPRPSSIAVTGITHDVTKNIDNKKGETKPPLPKTRKSITKEKPTKSKTSPVDSTPKSLASPVNPSIIDTTIQSGDASPLPPEVATTPRPEEVVHQKDVPPEPLKAETTTTNVAAAATTSTAATITITPETITCNAAATPTTTNVAATTISNTVVTTTSSAVVSDDDIKQITTELIRSESTPQPQAVEIAEVASQANVETLNADKPSETPLENEMTTSITKVRINTEEEAKAALAERRRLAREEAERQAEQERLRIEMEAQAELERQRREEEQVQRLIEQQRIAEQARLEEAIKEQQKREEDEKLRREEEQRSKLLKEEADRKAREEAERKFAEQQERLKNEEKEREARRKRVEAIMRRTRGVNNANTPVQQLSDDKNENKSENKINGTKPVEQENGTKNGKDVDIVDNIIPDESVKNANTVSIDTLNSTDSLNSNNTWQTTQQYDPLM